MKCTLCQTGDAYIGITSVECKNDKCKFYPDKKPKKIDAVVDDDPASLHLLLQPSYLWDKPLDQIIDFVLPDEFLGKRWVHVSYVQKSGEKPCTFIINNSQKKYSGKFLAKHGIKYRLKWFASSDIYVSRNDPKTWKWGYRVKVVFY